MRSTCPAHLIPLYDLIILIIFGEKAPHDAVFFLAVPHAHWDSCLCPIAVNFSCVMLLMTGCLNDIVSESTRKFVRSWCETYAPLGSGINIWGNLDHWVCRVMFDVWSGVYLSGYKTCPQLHVLSVSYFARNKSNSHTSQHESPGKWHIMRKPLPS
jgi:hypothetical protein